MKYILLIVLSFFVLGSCDIPESNPDCSTVLCDYVAKSIKIKYVDKTTNGPLFYQGSPYTLDDLKITLASNSNYSPVIKFDSNDPAVIILTPLLGNEVLTLGKLTPDKITMETRAKGKECCAGIDIISLKINDETICAPCNDLNGRVVVIKK